MAKIKMHIRNVATKAIEGYNAMPNQSFVEPGNTSH